MSSRPAGRSTGAFVGGPWVLAPWKGGRRGDEIQAWTRDTVALMFRVGQEKLSTSEPGAFALHLESHAADTRKPLLLTRFCPSNILCQNLPASIITTTVYHPSDPSLTQTMSWRAVPVPGCGPVNELPRAPGVRSLAASLRSPDPLLAAQPSVPLLSVWELPRWDRSRGARARAPDLSFALPRPARWASTSSSPFKFSMARSLMITGWPAGHIGLRTREMSRVPVLAGAKSIARRLLPLGADNRTLPHRPPIWKRRALAGDI